MTSLEIDAVVPVLLFGRLLLFLTPLPDILKDDHQLASPLTSFSRLKEGIHLYHNGVDPYSGGGFRHSPILLSAFSTVLPLSSRLSALLWTSLDGLAALAMAQIWRARYGQKEIQASKARERMIMILYLFNPYLLLPNLARSTASIDNVLVALTLKFASERKASPALLLLAVLTHLSLPSICLAPPVLMLLVQRSTHPHAVALKTPTVAVEEEPPTKKAPGHAPQSVVQLTLEYLVYLMILAGVSTVVAGGWHWTGRTWGALLSLPDLTPNPGLWWYFFTEMFDHFRPFFLVAFSMHLLIYVAPICIKFHHDPLYAAFVLQGVIASFKPYPTLADPGLFISMFALFPEIFPYLRHPIVTILLHMHAALLLPLFHSLWLSQGTGNANFYYATTLVFGLAMAATVIDAVWAGLRVKFGPKQEGWEIIQT
ncbi:hypothetical protein FRB95_007197 [Tulasnella sp. JGI-2019a]|nr:hypothetical protein FRB95_007197 [Tulasnella sp. JGI-2019a]